MFIALKLYTLAYFEAVSCSNTLSASCLHFTGKKALLFDIVHLFVQEAKNSQNLNRYTYVFNNPLSYTDSSGYSAWSKFRDKILKPVAAIVITIYSGGAASSIVMTGFLKGGR